MISMVTEIVHEGRPVFLCDVCGFGYKEREIADECEDYCTAYNSCSIEITAKAVYVPEKPTIKKQE